MGNIVFAVAKPPIAKVSNTVGRAEAYTFCIMCYLLGYILCASSSTFGVYAGGFVFANIGQTGVNILNDIIISDITSMRARAFGISISFFPFLITPWISGFIVEGVVNPSGIGWRWGIGMSTKAVIVFTNRSRNVRHYYANSSDSVDRSSCILSAKGEESGDASYPEDDGL